MPPLMAWQQQHTAAVSRLTGPFSRAALVPRVPIKFFSDYTHSTHTHICTQLRNNGAAVSGVMLVSSAVVLVLQIGITTPKGVLFRLD